MRSRETERSKSTGYNKPRGKERMETERERETANNTVKCIQIPTSLHSKLVMSRSSSVGETLTTLDFEHYGRDFDLAAYFLSDKNLLFPYNQTNSKVLLLHSPNFSYCTPTHSNHILHVQLQAFPLHSHACVRFFILSLSLTHTLNVHL